MNEYTTTFKTLGDETRLRILMMLKVRPLCVCELYEALDVALSTLSAHLKILKGSGLVEDAKDGRWVIYRLSSDRPFLAELLDKLEERLEGDKTLRRDRSTIARVTRELCSLRFRKGRRKDAP